MTTQPPVPGPAEQFRYTRETNSAGQGCKKGTLVRFELAATESGHKSIWAATKQLAVPSIENQRTVRIL